MARRTPGSHRGRRNTGVGRELRLPLAAAQFWLLRHAGPVRPLPVQLLGATGAAMLVSAALSLLHPLDTAVLILLWHGLALVLVALLGWVFGRGVMLRPLAMR